MIQLDNLSTTYAPKSVEPQVRELWEQGGFFHPDPGDTENEAYNIVIPPPNVTGALHGGHALNNTLQDILIRWRRMQGRNTMWMPGTDHAGIATQAVVERTVFEQEKKTRHDLGREELVKRIWEWKEAYGNRIIEQLKLMGCSCDWERTRFTLDEICARAVRHTFFKLFRDGLIVRGKRLVNWDTHLQTAVADDEVYHETVHGHLWHIRYPLKEPARLVRDGKEVEVIHLEVATTRPETMLGDTAVAVHPEDERWKPLIGKTVNLPLVNREIPIIADPILVDMEFGTGCVKVTPAHDPNDYACGQRNKLEMINILTPDGNINENGGPYKGMDRYEARKKVVEDLETQSLMVKIEDHESDVGHSDRSKTPIEPYLSDQWFIQMGDLQPEQAAKIEGLRGSSGLAQLAMDSVCHETHASADQRKACGKVHFFPSRYAKTYLDWLSEKRDWCISRQLWWGHRIPVWSRIFELTEDNWSEEFLDVGMDSLLEGNWGGTDKLAIHIVQVDTDEVISNPRNTFFPVVKDTEGTYRFHVCLVDDDPEIIHLLEQAGFVQDPDVLDTWFSSALWPHSTMGWPEQTDLMARYYPGSVLSTAREIITLWVARMVLTGMYNIGRVPFHDVYIHAVIQDHLGRPFKKTLGNGFDPVDIIETYGADALRYTMAAITTETQDIRMPMKQVKLDDGRELQTSERFELGRNFCNKIWNAARFAFMNLEGTNMAQLDPTALPIEDRWILSQVSRAAADVQDALAKFQFSRAANAARDFFWDSLCDWYLELVKPRINQNQQPGQAKQVLAFALDQSIRLLHPFIPFITERLWEHLNDMVPQRGLPGYAELDTGQALIVSSYPPVEGWKTLAAPEVDAVFADLQTATRAIRDIRQKQNVPPKNKADVTIKVPAERVGSLQHEAHVIKLLARVGELTIDAKAKAPKNAATLVVGDMQIFVADVIDPSAERKRLAKELENLDKQITGITNKLGNENFVSRAPADVVQRERQRLAELQAKCEKVTKTMSELE
ncbi:MAG: valine--tRNA ligase [Planctomycetota bacterium]|jgi:valyl-tRNA synthetase